MKSYRQSATMKRVVAIIPSGGRGSRLKILTDFRPKPLLFFGGKYRIIDIAMSNLLHSGITHIEMPVQYEGEDLARYIHKTYPSIPYHREVGTPFACQTKDNEHGIYLGTADAVLRTLLYLEKSNDNPSLVFILPGDHICGFDVEKMIEEHYDRHADFSICAMPVPIDEAAKRFGVLKMDASGRITEFQEKPERPDPLPDDPTKCLASMGIYVGGFAYLRDVLQANAMNPDTGNDFGFDVIPQLIYSNASVYAHDYTHNDPPGQKRVNGRYYWADIGDPDAYWRANMLLVSMDPPFNLYTGKLYPFLSSTGFHAPAKDNDRRLILNSGCLIDKSNVAVSIFGHNVFARKSKIRDVIAFQNVYFDECFVKYAIVEEYNHIPAGTVIGENVEDDIRLGIKIYDSPYLGFKIRVVPKGLFP